MADSNDSNIQRWLLVAGVVGFLAVVCGAFGAHGIEEAIPNWYDTSDLKANDLKAKADDDSASEKASQLPEWYQLDQLHQKKLRTWITGVRYHFYHTFAIMAVGLIQLYSATRSRKLDTAAFLFLIGIVGFSGSIYLYVITKIKILGMTAALGGVIFLAGWFFFVWGVTQSLRDRRGTESDSSMA